MAIALLSPSVLACGGTSKDTIGPASQVSAKPRTVDNGAASRDQIKDSNDLDDDSSSDDDSPVVNYGRAASAMEKKSITAVVRRYYAAAVAADGARACSMLVTVVAEMVPEEISQASSPAGLRGKTCAAALSKLFEQRHSTLAANLTALDVTRVRVAGRQALVVLSFATTPEPRKMAVRREGGAWKVKELLDSGMP